MERCLMNIGKYFSDGLKTIQNPDSNLKQILILASMAVIFVGFSSRQSLMPSYGIPEPPIDYGGFDNMGYEQNEPEGWGGEGYGPWDMGNQGFKNSQNQKPQKSSWVETDKKKKHKHHHHEEREENPPYNRPEPQFGEAPFGSEEFSGNLNSSEVPYTVE
jgi:hypothetical protein